MKIKTKLALLLAFLQTSNILANTVAENLSPSELSGKMVTSALKTASTKDNNLALEIFNTSLSDYIVNQYNAEDYTQHISQNGNDFLLLLEALKEAELGQEESLFQAYTIFKLFNDKLKGSMAIDDTVLNHILPSLPGLIKRYFKAQYTTSISVIKSEIEFLLQSNLLENFSDFASKPEKCISQISQKLAVEHKQRQQSLIEKLENVNKLRGMVTRFLEGILNKTIWSMRSYEGIWSSVFSISEGLKKLFISEIINDEDELDGLYWSLTHRFCFFLDLRGAFLPISFYEELEEDLLSSVIPFLEEEQDDLIKTKKYTLAQALAQAKIKAIAYNQNGIFSE